MAEPGAHDSDAAPPRPVLDTTLTTPFAVGVNVKGRAAGAAWTFLLPRLELATVACIGLPSRATLTTLARLARTLLVVVEPRQLDHAQRDLAEIGAAGARAITAADAREDLGPIDLAVVVAGAPAGSARDAVLSRAELAYADEETALAAGRRLWLAPGRGEVHRAAAADDATAVALLDAAGGAGGHGPRAVLRRLVRRGGDGHRLGRLAGAGDGPPAYVVKAAAASGIDVSRCRVALSAPSEYASRKAVLFLLEPGAPAARWVVKLTREPALNYRLRNEERALRMLQDAGIGDAETLPRAVFSGAPAGLALIGETAVAGAPLRDRSDRTPACPAADAALRWLLALGEAGRREAPSRGAVGDALTELLDRYCALYAPAAREREQLSELIAQISAAGSPTVFQHGDPGSWNVLVTDDGRPVFLDWEAFEPRGIPLWDAFYLARSHAVTVGRARGMRDPLRAVRAALVDADGEQARRLAALLDEHCARIELDRALALPLLATCWMHRALKEATRLRPGHLHEGHYARLLRVTLASPGAPGLRRIGGR